MLFLDHIAVDRALCDLRDALTDHPAPKPVALPCDRWIARSVLQKAIRRGETPLAQRALANLWEYDRRATWRALVIVALEDVGVANIDILARLIAAQGNRPWREAAGGDWVILAELTRQMAEGLHCQAACDLLLRATNDPALEHARATTLEASPRELATQLWDGGVDILDKGAAALAMGGALFEGQKQSDPCGVFDILAEVNRSPHVVATCRAAWKLSRNPMAMLLPLVWEHWFSAEHRVADDERRPVQMIDGVPGYALDQFTRIGNTISRALLREDDRLRQLLNGAGLPTGQQPRAVGDLLFISEGGLLAKRALWRIGDQLRLPERQLPAVIKLAEHLPHAVAHLESKVRHIALLRQQHFHPG